jgi:hypothetical protein
MRNTARQTRENRTITVDFHDAVSYYCFVRTFESRAQ